jgi:hypothetical protein
MYLKIFTIFILALFISQVGIKAQIVLSNDCASIDATTTLPINDCSNSSFRVNTTNFSAVALGTCSNANGTTRRDGWAGFTAPTGADNRVVVQYNHSVPPISPAIPIVFNNFN